MERIRVQIHARAVKIFAPLVSYKKLNRLIVYCQWKDENELFLIYHFGLMISMNAVLHLEFF